MSFLRMAEGHGVVLQALCQKELENIEAMAGFLVERLSKGARVFVAGNGGSAADAQHFAAELTGRFVKERRPLPAVALTTDTSALTAIANDYDYDCVFVRQLEALAQKEDVFLAISTSGYSKNVMKAVRWAKDNGVYVLGLTGKDGGDLISACDYAVLVPSAVTAHIQEMHILLIHYLCEQIDACFA